MSFTFKLLPTKEVPSTGVYCQSSSKEKAKGSLRPLAEAANGWAYAMALPLSLEGAVALFQLLADCCCIQFSLPFSCTQEEEELQRSRRHCCSSC
jgi:hypothetical protein